MLFNKKHSFKNFGTLYLFMQTDGKLVETWEDLGRNQQITGELV